MLGLSARKGSDWDILIVLPKSQLQQADYDQVSYPLVELGWTLGEQINPNSSCGYNKSK